MGERVVVRPVLEGRPADRVVAADRIAEEGVLEHGAAAVADLVIGTVRRARTERRRETRAGRSERRPPRNSKARHVQVGSMIPFTCAPRRPAREGRAGGARLDLGVDSAAVGRLEGERARIGGLGQHQPAGGDPERLVLRGQGDRERRRLRIRPPVGVRASAVRGGDASERGAHKVAVAAVEEKPPSAVAGPQQRGAAPSRLPTRHSRRPT